MISPIFFKPQPNFQIHSKTEPSHNTALNPWTSLESDIHLSNFIQIYDGERTLIETYLKIWLIFLCTALNCDFIIHLHDWSWFQHN